MGADARTARRSPPAWHVSLLQRSACTSGWLNAGKGGGTWTSTRQLAGQIGPMCAALWFCVLRLVGIVEIVYFPTYLVLVSLNMCNKYYNPVLHMVQ